MSSSVHSYNVNSLMQGDTKVSLQTLLRTVQTMKLQPAIVDAYRALRQLNIRRGLVITAAIFFLTISAQGAPIRYSYDSLNRLTQIIYPDGTTISYTYDKNGNRLSRIVLNQNNSTPFLLTDRGGVSVTTQGTPAATQVAYAAIQPDAGRTTPAGLAIFGFRENGILVTEAGVPASPLIQGGRIYAEVNGPVNTGLAIANPSVQDATISFFFTDAAGRDYGQGSIVIPANGQIAKFLTEAPFNGGASVSGTFTFTSSAPVAVIALRGYTNERSEFLITTLPVASISPINGSSDIFPHFADGQGWTTQVVLVNSTDTAMTGMLQFVGQLGQPAPLAVNGQLSDTFPYSIPSRSSRSFLTSGGSPNILIGSVRAIPDGGSSTPSGDLIFSYNTGGITVAQAGVPAIPPSTAFRMYAEESGDISSGAVGSIETGIAIANPSSTAVTVNFELTTLDGSSLGLTGSQPIPAQGQTALFLNQIHGFEGLQNPFQGVLRISSGTSPISVIGLRGRYNERHDFLMTTTPPIDESSPASNANMYFPQVADGGGFTTQFILFSGTAGQASSGTLKSYSQSGQPLGLALLGLTQATTTPPTTLAIPLKPTNPNPGSTSGPGPTVASTTVTLNWTASSGTTYYSLGVRDVGNATLAVDTTASTNSYTVTLSSGKQYRWNVNACNAAGCSSYTDVLYFQTPTLSTGSISSTGSMTTARGNHTATLLRDGRVLIAGGNPGDSTKQLASAELYDSASGTFSATGAMNIARWGHSAILMDDGRVLIAGGWISSYIVSTATAEIYDPKTGRFTLSRGSMSIARADSPGMVKLSSGKILIIGGTKEGSFGTATANVDIYDPQTDLFTQIGNLAVPRRDNGTILLTNGDVLVVGGLLDCCTASQNAATEISAEIFSSTTNISTAVGNMNIPRARTPVAVTLNDGRVFVTGGGPGTELYNPTAHTFAVTGDPTLSPGSTATVLLDGRVLVSGNGARLYTEATESFVTVSLDVVRGGHSSTRLSDGRVLLTGGSTPTESASRSALIFAP